MSNYVVSDNKLTLIANAIRAKGNTSASLTFPNGFIEAIDDLPDAPILETLSVTNNGEYTPGTGVDGFNRVTVNVSGGSVASNVVNFRDYDGTIVASYSAEDFAELVALPSNPNHTSEGLTAQGWNWSLSDAKTYVAKYGYLEIGQMYITTDGKTHIHIHLEQGRTSPKLGVCPNGTVDVDWGDETIHDTLTGTSITEVKWTSNHSYAAPGDYVIKLTVTGSMGFYGNSTTNHYSGLLRYSSSADGRNTSYRSSILNINIGDNVTSIDREAFYYCYNLSSITIPDSITSIGISAFQHCYSLSSITIPDSVTSIGSNAFVGCYSLSSITIPDGITNIENNTIQGCYNLSNIIIPDSVTSIGNGVFTNCRNLSSITIPNGTTSIGSEAFNSCSSLSSITIPDSVTTIGASAFNTCYNLSSITIPGNVTNISNNTFNSCYNLSSITISYGVTSIGINAFYYCYSLSSITIPDSITSIGSGAFQNCYSLSSITIPNSVTSISAKAFQNCTSIAEYHFKSTTPPTLADANAFSGIPDDCIIYVPYSADHSILEAYKTATNWSAYADRMQEES